MDFYLSASWTDSPFEIAALDVWGRVSELLVCWPSQDLNSPSL